MRHVPRFYVSGDLKIGGLFVLPKDVSHHLIRVLRKGVGDEFKLFNGGLDEFTACLVSDQAARIDRLEQVRTEAVRKITLIQALVKPDTFDWLLEKATELGVCDIVPVYSEYSVNTLRKQGDTKRQSRWEKIVMQAAQQSGRTRLPRVHAIQDFVEVLGRVPSDASKFIFSPRIDGQMDPLAGQSAEIFLCIGPEGGWGDAELSQAQAHDFQVASWGPRILRTETAVIAALTLSHCSGGNQ